MFQQLSKINCARLVSASVLAVVFSMCTVNTAEAASLYVFPSTAQVSIGNIVSVKILVSTQGKSVNNSEGVIQFPADLLEVISISKNSSVFTLWVEDPKFSNYNGQITFNGGVPNPGYTGESGEIVSVTFKAKKSGTASIVFSDSVVRENNGLGTDILTLKQPGVITISSGTQSEITPVTTSSNTVPVKPIVISSTHSKQESWYSGNSATFSWTVPSDVTSLQTLLSKSPTSIPTVTYDGSVSQKTVNNLADGVLYFHLRYQNNVGYSSVAHYKIQIDSTPPDKFSINVTENDLQRIVTLNATDALSGVDSYFVKIDDSEPVRVKVSDLVDNKYVLPTQNRGNHNLVVIAYDKAGNHTESDTIFYSPEITPPSLTIYPDYVTRNDTVKIGGTTDYPNENAIVYTQHKGDEIVTYQVTTSADGSFGVITKELKSTGSVSVWSELLFSNNIKSRSSNKISFEVHDTKFVRTAKTISYTLSMLIMVIALLLILIFLTYMGWHKFFGMKKRIKREVNMTVDDIHKALQVFKEELAKQLAVIEKAKQDRELNKKEEKIFKELQSNIDTIDDLIEKKLRKIS